MFFKCAVATWREDLCSEECHPVSQIDGLFDISLPRFPTNMDLRECFSAYLQYVEYYTSRSLTLSNDMLNAFAGISKVFESQMRTVMYYGLPVGFFDLALLWSTDNVIRHRLGFPSWSWAGWVGNVNFIDIDEYELARYLITHTWIEWYYHCDIVKLFKPLSDLLCKDDGQALTTKSMSQQYRAYLSGHQDIIIDPIDDDDPCGSETIRETCKGLGITSLLPKVPSLNPHGAHTTLKTTTGQLRFFTLSVHFEISHTNTAINDCDGNSAGFLSISNDLSIKDLGQGRPGRQEVILLSRMLSSGDVIYRVMIIDWKDGIAYRMGVGYVYKRSLAKSFEPGPQWKEITLG